MPFPKKPEAPAPRSQAQQLAMETARGGQVSRAPGHPETALGQWLSKWGLGTPWLESFFKRFFFLSFFLFCKIGGKTRRRYHGASGEVWTSRLSRALHAAPIGPPLSGPGYPARGRTGLPPHEPPAASQLTFPQSEGAASKGRCPSPPEPPLSSGPCLESLQSYRGGPTRSTAVTAQAGSSHGRTERQTPLTRHRAEHPQS